MDLILWRHCEAEPGEPDLGRRLTSKGLKQGERMAQWLDTQNGEPGVTVVAKLEKMIEEMEKQRKERQQKQQANNAAARERNQ